MDLEPSVQAKTKPEKFEVEGGAEPDKSKPGDWVQGTTNNGQIYYYNTTTGGWFLLRPNAFFLLLYTVLPKQINSCSKHV